MLRRIPIVLALVTLTATAIGQNPNTSVGSTTISVTAHSTPVDAKIVNGNTLTVDVDVQIEDKNHAYNCNASVTVTVGDNEKSRREVAKEIADAIKARIKECLTHHGLPAADADVDKFVRCKGSTVIVKATPPVGDNTGTPEKPKMTYEGRLTNTVRTEIWTTK